MAQKVDLFRANVRRHVQLTGITYRILAEKAGITREYLSHMLGGRSSPTLAVCERIAAALGTSLEALLAEPATRPQPIVAALLSDHKMADPENSAK